jgi:tetratricopeptide (TPR) repeat protein
MPNYYLMWTGHLEEAVDQIDRHTTEGAPWQIGWIPPFEERYENTLPQNAKGFASLYLSLGEIDRAMEQAHWLLAMNSKLSRAAHLLLADCHFLKGQEDDALREWMAAAGPSLPKELRERFQVAHRESGMRGVWQLTLALLPEKAALDRRGPFYARLGDRDKTFEWLEHAIEKPSFFPDFLDPYVASMRDDPRFERLLRRANLPEDAIARHLAYEADGWVPRGM